MENLKGISLEGCEEFSSMPFQNFESFPNLKLLDVSYATQATMDKLCTN